MKDGLIEIPTEPGLGVELNWDVIHKYGVDLPQAAT